MLNCLCIHCVNWEVLSVIGVYMGTWVQHGVDRQLEALHIACGGTSGICHSWSAKTESERGHEGKKNRGKTWDCSNIKIWGFMFPSAASSARCTGELTHAIREAVHGRHESRPALCCFNVHLEPKQERQTGAFCFTMTPSTMVVLTKTSHKIEPLACKPALQQWTVKVLISDQNRQQRKKKKKKRKKNKTLDIFSENNKTHTMAVSATTPTERWIITTPSHE